MSWVKIRFHDQLTGLLHPRDKGSIQILHFKGDQTIKHLVESLGVPHTEVGTIQVDEKSVDFDYLVKEADSITIQPAAPNQDQLSGLFKDGEMTIPARFILDNHLGKLASFMRMLGLDTDYRNDYQDDELANTAVEHERILLTRDRQLLMRKIIRFGYLPRSLQPENQLVEIIHRFDLGSQMCLFQRCLRCNHPLEPVEKNEIEHHLQPLTKKYFHDFHVCTGCQQVFWRGSHVERMQERLAGILSPEICLRLNLERNTDPY